MKARRSKFMDKMLRDPGFVKALMAAADAAIPPGSAPESGPVGVFEFDYGGAHYRFATRPELLAQGVVE